MDASRLSEPQPAAKATAVPPDRTIADRPAPIAGRFEAAGQPVTIATGTIDTAGDIQTGAAVMLHIVDPRSLPTATMADRALRELKQLAKVKSDKVLRVVDQGKTADGRVYIASEAVEGPTLEDLVTAEGPLSLERARAIVLGVGEALVEAQKVGVIHRDLSPRNVIVGDTVKVTGFGIAEPVDDKVFGAPAFMSPEQAEGKPVDQRSNIYSLGALLYYMVTGEPPFSGDAHALVQQHLHAQPSPPSQNRPGLPNDIDKVVLKALEKSGGRRHLTLRQLLNDVESIAAPGAVAPAPSPAPVLRGDSGPARTILGMEAPMRPLSAVKSEPIPLKTPVDRNGHSDVGATDPTLQPVSLGEPVSPDRITAPSIASLRAAAEPGAATMIDQRAPEEVMRAAAAIAAANAASPPVVEPAPPPAAARLATPAPPAASAAAKVVSAKGPAVGRVQADAAASKGKRGFRETAWFKKGELEEEMAKKAAELSADDPLSGPAHTEAVVEDSSLTADDRARLSLKTGRTEHMPAVKPGQIPGGQMSEEDMIAEMESGTRRALVVVGSAIGGLALLATIYFVFLRH